MHTIFFVCRNDARIKVDKFSTKASGKDTKRWVDLLCTLHFILSYNFNYAENFQTYLIKVKVISVPVNACLFNHGKSNNC